MLCKVPCSVPRLLVEFENIFCLVLQISHENMFFEPSSVTLKVCVCVCSFHYSIHHFLFTFLSFVQDSAGPGLSYYTGQAAEPYPLTQAAQ